MSLKRVTLLINFILIVVTSLLFLILFSQLKDNFISHFRDDLVEEIFDLKYNLSKSISNQVMDSFLLFADKKVLTSKLIKNIYLLQDSDDLILSTNRSIDRFNILVAKRVESLNLNNIERDIYISTKIKDIDLVIELDREYISKVLNLALYSFLRNFALYTLLLLIIINLSIKYFIYKPILDLVLYLKMNKRLNREIFIEELEFLKQSFIESFEELKSANRELKIEKAQKERLLIEQSKMAQMGEMIGAIAHQWKQPLNVISLISDSLINLDKMESLLEEDEIEKIEKKIDEIHSQINFMSQTIDDFRNFFKPSKEKIRFNINQEIEKVLDIMGAQLKKHNINYQLTSNREIIYLFGYPNEFKQVILNIISNAKDAYEERNIKERVINIDIDKRDDIVSISIEDRAGGIKEELLPDEIFNEYVSTKGELGTGIGLAISKKIVTESMGGKIFAKNQKDGAKFVIEFSKDNFLI